MPANFYETREKELITRYQRLVNLDNEIDRCWNHGIYERYRDPVLTADHVPLNWRFELDPDRNPYLLERLMVNSVFNSGAIILGDKVCLVSRIEGADRKSFFAVAESFNGIDHFAYWETPVVIPEGKEPDNNTYDMRLTRHEDGWIYGVFASERKAPHTQPGVLYEPFATAAIARTRDLIHWERLPDVVSGSAQQRNVVLHPEFVDGGYGFYTRPQDGFMDAGAAPGIGWATCEDITHPVLSEKTIIDRRAFNTIKSAKNGAGAPPIKTEIGWLHIAHGVRNTAAGLRYVLYVFVCDLEEPWRTIYQPGGYFMAPQNDERVGDVSNVLFTNGAVLKPDGTLLIYYASSDTRLHVASTDLGRMLDYAINTPPDSTRSAIAVQQRLALIEKNEPRWRALRSTNS